MTNTSRIALVTGANKGIGLEIARELAQSGLRVLLASRDMERGAAAAAALAAEGLDIRALQLDVTDAQKIAAAAADVAKHEGRIDILVNNAGISAPGEDNTPGSASMAAVRRIFETNFFGAAAVTQAMLPLLMKSSAGRIVNVSSGLGSLARNGDPLWKHANVKRLGYNASKAALNMMTIQLAVELAPFGIKVNAADPGFTATDLNGYRGTQTIPEGAAAAVRLALLDDFGPTGGFFNAEGREPW